LRLGCRGALLLLARIACGGKPPCDGKRLVVELMGLEPTTPACKVADAKRCAEQGNAGRARAGFGG
jgi:hypothetical protein